VLLLEEVVLVNQIHSAALMPRVGLLIAAMAGVLVSGCGSGGMGRVSGTVTHQGQPLQAGTVTFIATDGERPNASGDIQPDGSYSLQTTEPGDGAVVGEYQVAISGVDSAVYNTPMPGMPAEVPKSVIPEKYSDPSTSGLTATVESGSNTKDFDLQ
jgi:hypothetical protein